MNILEITAYAVPPFFRLATKFLYFVALAGAIGLPITHLLVVRPAVRDADPSDRALMLSRSHRLMGMAGGLLLVGAFLQLVARVARTTKTSFGQSFSPSRIAGYLSTPAAKGEWIPSATLVVAQNLLYLLASVAFLALLARQRTWLVTLAGGATILGSLVNSLPTKQVDADALLGKLLVQAHIVASSVWVGGLVLCAGLAALRPALGSGAGRVWAEIWQRFGQVALWSVGAVVVSGMWLTREGVGSVEQLWTTVFGRVLLAKVLLVGLMMAAGGYNQLVLMPAIERARAAGDDRGTRALALHRFPSVVVTEVVIAVGVLLVMPFLAGSARAEAGMADVGPLDGATLAIGMLLTALLALSFWLTTRASALRSVVVEPTPRRLAA